MKKRKLAVFLLSVMALVAVQPVIAMHFCQGKLHSWDLFVNNDTSSCCQTKTTDDSCTPTYASDNHSYALNETHDNCCDFETIQVSTDEYQHQTQDLSSGKLFLSLENVWFVLSSLLNANAVEESTNLSLKDFPPQGHFLQDVSILNYICVYRI